MIRGVKVRQAGTKSETKRPGKSQRNQHASTASGNNGSSSKKHLSKREEEGGERS